MTYQETLEFLYAQLPMFSRIGAAAYKKDINNTILLCEALGNPQNKFKSIHIAGTNGKGSTSSMLAAMLQQQGYKTGLYTSPHIKDFGERIRINGLMIDQEFVINFVKKNITLCDNIKPSFFELTVAMAFDYFAQENVDIAIIETGLGGRLDSTNIISPILSIITNIGLDHTNLLGNTIEEIAMEKAGIIKHNTPVVIGEANTKTKNIFIEKAASLDAPIYFATNHYEVTEYSNQLNLMQCKVFDKTSLVEETFKLDLNGQYQLKNLCTVLMAENILHKIGFDISNKNEKWALQNVKKIAGLKGRWDVIAKDPYIIMDVAHNKDGITQVLNQLQTQYTKSNYHFVLGFVNDKDINEILALLPRSAHYYFTNAHIARALPHQELKSLAQSKNLIGESYDNVNEAIVAAKKNTNSTDVIMICGSFFILSEVDEFQILSNLEKP